MILKSLKILMITVLAITLTLVIIGVLFLNFSPEFGGTPSKENISEYEQLDYFSEGKFSNLIPTDLDMNIGKAIRMIPKFFKNDPARVPSFPLPIISRDSVELVQDSLHTRLIWFGHSAFLLQIDGKNILIDPMLGEVPAPNPLLGKKRFFKDLPIEIEKLPQIDIILISHDHYDHLDYGSIQKLKGKTKQFYVPLGVGAHFERWGVDAAQIHEMQWWEEAEVAGISLAFAPTRHFSGRGATNRFSTLWGSWVITGKNDNIYFSGDGGYGPHFKEIGEKYGPFDFAMMECGQYNENWKEIHMMPEQTAQAGQDVRAKVMMPIHWAAFTLAMHSWTDPVERVTAKAKEINQPIFVPKIGEFINLQDSLWTKEEWWIKP
jgi:L-ascorbate metabolism protein UlaG (beta-lactamase superfamily)